MNIKKIITTAIVSGIFICNVAGEDTVAPGKKAPTFKLPDINGNEVELSSFKGKYIVLEWTNYDCPFVLKHYKSGNMQALQKKYIKKGVVWLVINSSAQGKQGNFTPEQWKKLAAERNSQPTAILLDSDGNIGRMYRARTTPHMFVIDPEGALIYMGAIDDKAGHDMREIETAKNYVQLALDAAMAGKPVENAVTIPYGCSVKY